MRLVDTVENTADPVGEFVSTEQPLGLNNLAFAMDPPRRLYQVKPRAFRRRRQGTVHTPYPASGIFDFPVMVGDPVAYLMTLMPGDVIPDEKQRILACRSEFPDAVAQKLRGNRAYGTVIHEPAPTALQLRNEHPVTCQSFRLGIVFWSSLLDEAHGVALISPAMHRRSLEILGPRGLGGQKSRGAGDLAQQRGHGHGGGIRAPARHHPSRRTVLSEGDVIGGPKENLGPAVSVPRRGCTDP